MPTDTAPPEHPPLEAGVLAAWPAADRATLAGYTSRRAFPSGAVTLQDPGWWVLTSGEARLLEHGSGRELAPGDSFGEDALALPGVAEARLVASSAIGLAYLSVARFEALAAEHPRLGVALLRALWPPCSAEAGRKQVGLVQLTLPDGPILVPEYTPLSAALPDEIAGKVVIAATLDGKVVALDTPVSGDARVVALTDADTEGHAVIMRSLGLVLLEAANQVVPGLRVQLGSSFGDRRDRQEVRLDGEPGLPLPELATRLGAAMAAIVAEARPIRRESWTLEHAAMRFEGQGWTDVVALLRNWRGSYVAVRSCGMIHALAMGPFVIHAGLLTPFRVVAGPAGIELHHGEATRGEQPDVGLRQSFTGAWLQVLGVHDLGSFNEACVSGQVSQMIRAAEGSHEKRIGQIADRIAARGEVIRAIGIAGPSSSGKTTFIKRLTVQLQINGIRPHAISLDDYYVDRALTPLALDGEYDYEALEALNLPLLRAHVTALLAGGTVRTAHYDFKSGIGIPDGGPEIQLGPRDVLMLEGIHALNPRLLGAVLGREQMVRIFVWPATTLPIDRLSHFALADLRLLRRIVRDRHTRGADAAANIMRWPSVRHGENRYILPFLPDADEVFDTALVYEPAVLKVFAERYLLEVPRRHPAYPTAYRLRQLLDNFVAIYPDHVPPTSILREFIGGSGFEY